MKIAYDHQIFATQAYGGISRYFCEIAERLALCGCEVRILAPVHISVLAGERPDTPMVGVRMPAMPRTRRLRLKLDTALVRQMLRREPPDIVHETYYAHSTVAPKQSRIVVTVHDMIYEKAPEFFPHDQESRALKAEAVRRADHVICVSKSARNDLLDVLDINPAKVSVIYHGCTLRATNGHEPPGELRETGPFLLYVGLRSRYKNFHRLIEAYGASLNLRKDFRLICFGGPSFSADETQHMKSFGVRERVSRVEGDDSVLRRLYSSAACLVYPSLYEGFGIPVLEAMSCECPVSCSHTSCLPEIAGNAAEYFDPTNIDSVRAALEKVVYSPERATELVQRGKERAAQFSWDTCAQQTFQVYSSLI